MVKYLIKIGKVGTFFKLMKVIYEKLTENIFVGEKQSCIIFYNVIKL